MMGYCHAERALSVFCRYLLADGSMSVRFTFEVSVLILY
jgi:hypothetical protein